MVVQEVMILNRRSRLLSMAKKLCARGACLSFAGLTLWCIWVVAPSENATDARTALVESAAIQTLQWELGDWMQLDSLNVITAMTVHQSPFLGAVRPTMADLWAKQEADTATPNDPDGDKTPVTETPITPALPPILGSDNGVPARTLVATGGGDYIVCGNVYISNSTDYTIMPQEVMESFDATLGPDEPQILIIHSHGSEAYTPSPNEVVEYSSHMRTLDNRYNVVRMGDEMADVFASMGISVLHDRTLYDYPSYSEAYDRSLAAMESYLVQYPSIRFILDVHRDAIEDSDGNQYKLISNIDEHTTAAQLSLVLGTSGSGLDHPQWMENLKLSTAIGQQITSKYPTILRPVLLRNSRYNQHITTGSMLVEVGTAGNSPEEAALAARIFATEMGELLLAQSK